MNASALFLPPWIPPTQSGFWVIFFSPSGTLLSLVGSRRISQAVRKPCGVRGGGVRFLPMWLFNVCCQFQGPCHLWEPWIARVLLNVGVASGRPPMGCPRRMPTSAQTGMVVPNSIHTHLLLKTSMTGSGTFAGRNRNDKEMVLLQSQCHVNRKKNRNSQGLSRYRSPMWKDPLSSSSTYPSHTCK